MDSRTLVSPYAGASAYRPPCKAPAAARNEPPAPAPFRHTKKAAGDSLSHGRTAADATPLSARKRAAEHPADRQQKTATGRLALLWPPRRSIPSERKAASQAHADEVGNNTQMLGLHSHRVRLLSVGVSGFTLTPAL
jgi:hypothetical protein